jgi:hypothetical protein
MYLSDSYGLYTENLSVSVESEEVELPLIMVVIDNDEMTIAADIDDDGLMDKETITTYEVKFDDGKIWFDFTDGIPRGMFSYSSDTKKYLYTVINKDMSSVCMFLSRAK